MPNYTVLYSVEYRDYPEHPELSPAPVLIMPSGSFVIGASCPEDLPDYLRKHLGL